MLGDGAIAAGATFAGIPTYVKENELASCIVAAQVKWLFVATNFLELALTTAQSLGINKPQVIVFDPPGLEPYCGPRPCLSRILRADESVWQNPYYGKDSRALTAFRLFTSGTTGSMKAAEISHAAQLSRLDAHGFITSPQDVRLLHIIGIYHVSGQITCNQACTGKLPAYLSSAYDAPTILDIIESAAIAIITLPPRIIEAITAAIHAGIRSKETLRSLNTVFFGGSPSQKEALKAFSALLPSQARLISAYASTEAGYISMTPVDPLWKLGYVGFPALGVELK